MQSKKVALYGILLALTLVLSLAESTLPPLFALFPYAKIGFANIVVVFVLVVLGAKPALLIAVLKCLCVAIFSGNAFSLAYSLPASFLSLLLMALLLRSRKCSLTFISLCGAVTHTLCQLATAAIVTRTFSVMVFLPHLLIIAMLSGAAIGVIDYLLIKKINFVQLGIN